MKEVKRRGPEVLSSDFVVDHNTFRFPFMQLGTEYQPIIRQD